MRPVAILLLALLIAGCSQPSTSPPTLESAYEQMGFDGTNWPRLDGVTLTILDHGAFANFDEVASLFTNLTGARVEHVEANDAGAALQRATLEKGDPTFDVVYGIDNVLYAKALAAGVFEPYEPLLATRIDPSHLFAGDVWHATPVDHGYVAVNWDPAAHAFQGDTIDDLDDVRAHASLFVTPDPRTSTPGLGFLLATIATYGEADEGGWKDYWRSLFANGALITSGWTEAYEQRFSAGYGVDYGGAGDKPIVTSYTTSPAYEHFFGREEGKLARVVTAPNATFHQIETMGIAKGTKNLAAAQAWIEFALTDAFQSRLAPGMAVYPVAAGVDVGETFGGVDPAPGSFEPAAFDSATLGTNVERWVREWVALCEAANCA